MEQHAPMARLRDQLARMFRVREDETTGGEIVIPRREERLVNVSSAEAFSLSIVYRAVQILVTATKQLSLGTYKGSEELPGAPLFMRQPEIGMPRSAFLESTVVSLACSGNAYWRIFRNERGEVSSLQVLNPHDMTIRTSPTTGKVTGYAYGTRREDFTPEEIKHLKLLRVPGTAYGLGPIQAAQKELRGALDVRDYSSNWFEESGIPNGVLTSDQMLTAETAGVAKATWNESNGAKKGVAVLGQGLKYAPVYLSPSDAQFLETQQFNVTQIARLFGVPSSLMLATVEGSTDTYQNVSQDWLGFVRFGLMAYLIEIEDAFSALLPRGTDAKFNVEALLRSDTTTRYAAHRTALEAGFMTVNEVRRIENLPDLPGGDQLAAKPAPAAQPAPTKEPIHA